MYDESIKGANGFGNEVFFDEESTGSRSSSLSSPRRGRAVAKVRVQFGEYATGRATRPRRRHRKRDALVALEDIVLNERICV